MLDTVILAIATALAAVGVGGLIVDEMRAADPGLAPPHNREASRRPMSRTTLVAGKVPEPDSPGQSDGHDSGGQSGQ